MARKRLGNDSHAGDSSENPFKVAREQLEQAESLRQNRRLDRAEEACTRLLRRNPSYFGALHTLGLVYLDKNDPARALGPLFRAAMYNPRSWSTLTALSGACLSLDAPEMAAQILEQALRLNPKEPSVLLTLGQIYREDLEYELARDAFRDALAQEPALDAAALGLGICTLDLGDYDEAAEILHTSFQRGARSLGLLSALVQLPPGLSKVDVLAELSKLAKKGGNLSAEQEILAAFVRAAALDRAGAHQEAWEEARRANRQQRNLNPKDLIDQRERELLSLKWLQDCAPAKSHRQPGQPISLLILGPSRSGKTTMEQLVCNLDGWKRGYENPSLRHAIHRTFQEAGLLTGWSLEQLPEQFFPNCRNSYIEELEGRAHSANVFTVTNPTNIFYCSQAVKIFPNLRFVFVKRNTEDLMIRIYFRQYRRGNSYAYDLNSTRDHIDWYFEMADIMAEKYPEIVRIVQYEDIVEDPTGAVRVTAELCNIELGDIQVDSIGDDRGCGDPYRELMATDLLEKQAT